MWFCRHAVCRRQLCFFGRILWQTYNPSFNITVFFHFFEKKKDLVDNTPVDTHKTNHQSKMTSSCVGTWKQSSSRHWQRGFMSTRRRVASGFFHRFFTSDAESTAGNPSPPTTATTTTSTGMPSATVDGEREPIRRYPKRGTKAVPSHIPRPPYANTGHVPPPNMELVYRHGKESVDRMREAARLARRTLDLACIVAEPGMTTDEVDTIVHNALIEAGAYPSPLNYVGFPKSLCTSVNEVVCHGIPDTRPLQFGDLVSFDVSCFLNGVHGDNCATIVVGDVEEGVDLATSWVVNDHPHLTKDEPKSDDDDDSLRDWRGIPYRTTNIRSEDEAHFQTARRLNRAAREALYAGLEVCRPGACLSEIGNAIHNVADRYGYSSVEKYRGHGIAHIFHCAPFVKHFRNTDFFKLEPGMIFTIEPMLVVGNQQTFEWDDDWTVATVDGSLAAQFEHTVLITEDSMEILTLP